MRTFKRKLFERGAAALKACGIDQNIYGCPICLRAFGEEDISYLTIEHVPPRSLKGAKLLLTCRDCNSNAGHRYEIDLANREKARESVGALLGHNTGDIDGASLTFSGERVDARAFRDDRGVSIVFDPKRTSPQASAAFDDLMRGENNPINFQFHITHRIREGRAELAELKSAYLWLFAKFGYGYATSPSVKQVRDALLNGEELVGFRKLRANELKPGYCCFPLSFDYALVNFGRGAILLPSWKVDAPEYASALAGGLPDQIPAHFAKLPTSFVGEIDHAGKSSVLLRPKQTPHEDEEQ